MPRRLVHGVDNTTQLDEVPPPRPGTRNVENNSPQSASTISKDEIKRGDNEQPKPCYGKPHGEDFRTSPVESSSPAAKGESCNVFMPEKRHLSNLHPALRKDSKSEQVYQESSLSRQHQEASHPPLPPQPNRPPASPSLDESPVAAVSMEPSPPPLPRRPNPPSPQSSSTTLAIPTEQTEQILTYHGVAPDDSAILRYTSHPDLWRKPSRGVHWTISSGDRGLAERCISRLRTGTTKTSFGALDLVRLMRIPKRYKQRTLDVGWELFLPDCPTVSLEYIDSSFCEHLFHVWEALDKGGMPPCDIPFSVRSRLDSHYRRVKRRLEVAPVPKHTHLVEWIGKLQGRRQGISLVACLELVMIHENQPLAYCHHLFDELTKSIKQLQTVQFVDDRQMVCFFATYVRVFRYGLDHPDTQSEGWQQHAADFLSKFWGYCPHLNDNPRRRLSIFENTIAKLDIFDIHLCLWVFVTIARDNKNEGDNKLCHLMEAELAMKTGPGVTLEVSWVHTVVVTLHFLTNVGHDGFSEALQPVMERYCGSMERIEAVWASAGKLEDYTRYRGLSARYRTQLKAQVSEYRTRGQEQALV